MVSVIIPCYNEQESLSILYGELKKVLCESKIEHEILFVNDGSTDSTLSILKDLSAKDESVKYYSFSRNFGKEAAMYAGFCNATGDYVAIMDADMQDPPHLLPEMLRIIEEEGYDSVATRRVTRKGEPPIRSFFARMFYKLINKISDTDIVDGARDYRLMKREMVDVIVEMGESNRFSKGIYGWIGFKTYWLPFENVERIAGETKWSMWELIKYALDGIICFSQVPLNAASWFGFFMTLVAVFFLLFVVIRKLAFGDPVAGWASTMSVILFLGGIQLFCIGVLGQYLSKTYIEVKKRPHYIISESNSKDTVKIKKCDRGTFPPVTFFCDRGTVPLSHYLGTHTYQSYTLIMS